MLCVSTPGAALAGAMSLAIAPLVAVHLPPRYQVLNYLMSGFGVLFLVLRPAGIIPTLAQLGRPR